MASTYIQRTASGTDTTYTQKRNTISMWFKRSGLSDACLIEGQGNDANATQAYFDSNTNLTINHVSGDASLNFQIVTNRKFRDTSAWYNLVIAIDTTLGTAADRVKIYVNGVLETSFASASYPGQNATTQLLANGNLNIIGRRKSGGVGLYFDGSMSYINVTDGTVYQASSFGSTDSTTGEWKINTSPSVTYGNLGFFILKNGNSVTDQSGEGNNFTVGGGTLTNTEDCPDNVFATMNPLDNYYPNFNLAYGSTSVGAGNGPRTYLLATMGLAPTGKYYWEIKLQGQSNGASSNSVLFGISQKSTDSTTEDLTDGVASSTVIDGSGRVYVEGSLAGTFGSSYEPSTVMCLAYDAVNNKMYFGKDGTWLNSGDPTSGSTGTGAFTPTATNGAYNNIYIPCWGVNYNSGYSVAFNFGNGYFNTSAVSSAGTNASSNGIFEHDVPTGYTALSTKGLNL